MIPADILDEALELGARRAVAGEEEMDVGGEKGEGADEVPRRLAGAQLGDREDGLGAGREAEPHSRRCPLVGGEPRGGAEVLAVHRIGEEPGALGRHAAGGEVVEGQSAHSQEEVVEAEQEGRKEQQLARPRTRGIVP